MKTIWTSKTFWGAVLGLIVYFIKSYYGADIREDDINQLAQYLADAGMIVSSMLVVYGRIAAREKIDVKGSVSVFNVIGHLVKIWNAIKR